jgi:hypothetical protein
MNTFNIEMVSIQPMIVPGANIFYFEYFYGSLETYLLCA